MENPGPKSQTNRGSIESNRTEIRSVCEQKRWMKRRIDGRKHKTNGVGSEFESSGVDAEAAVVPAFLAGSESESRSREKKARPRQGKGEHETGGTQGFYHSQRTAKLRKIEEKIGIEDARIQLWKTGVR